MTAFRYDQGPDRVRPDLAEAHRRAWDHIAAAGTWLSGDERVAVAKETRRARDCALCLERKAALSPFAVDGGHDHAGALPVPMVDEIHRVTTDAARLTEKWGPAAAPRPPRRALSLVPAEVRAWRDVSAAQYLGEKEMVRFGSVRAIDRSQIELVAGRVSALNECFY